jgi:hypothetical protein
MGMISGAAAALNGALPFAADLLGHIVECNRSGAERADPSASLRNGFMFFSDLADSKRIIPSTIDIPEVTWRRMQPKGCSPLNKRGLHIRLRHKIFDCGDTIFVLLCSFVA